MSFFLQNRRVKRDFLVGQRNIAKFYLQNYIVLFTFSEQICQEAGFTNSLMLINKKKLRRKDVYYSKVPIMLKIVGKLILYNIAI